MRLNVNIRMLRLGLLLMLLSATGLGTLAQQPSASAPNSTSASQPQSQPASDIKSLQQALAYAEYQKNRADEAERSRDEWKKESGDWKALFFDERKRSDLALSASGDRKEAGAQSNIAVSLLREQVADDKGYIKQLSDELRACQASKIKWALGGAGIGFGAGAFSRR